MDSLAEPDPDARYAHSVVHVWDGERGQFVDSRRNVELRLREVALLRSLIDSSRDQPAQVFDEGYDILFSSLVDEIIWAGARFRCGCGCDRPTVGQETSEAKLLALPYDQHAEVLFYSFTAEVSHAIDASCVAASKAKAEAHATSWWQKWPLGSTQSPPPKLDDTVSVTPRHRGRVCVAILDTQGESIVQRVWTVYFPGPIPGLEEFAARIFHDAEPFIKSLGERLCKIPEIAAEVAVQGCVGCGSANTGIRLGIHLQRLPENEFARNVFVALGLPVCVELKEDCEKTRMDMEYDILESVEPPIKLGVKDGVLQCAHCRYESYRGATGPAKGKLKACSKCHRTLYCSRECQVADWPKHKLVCGKQG